MQVKNRKYTKFDNPGIMVTNHPNTLLDPLSSAALFKHQFHFLVNASVYNNPVGKWFFSTFFGIPVARPKDKGSEKVNNNKSLEKAEQHIQNGGHIYIAPEGYSRMNRRIDPIKSGTARIALGAEERANWKAKVLILPVGLNYESPRFFRTDLLINIGKPIEVAKYKTQYQQDPFKAARMLTAELELLMKTLVLDTQNDQEDKAVSQLEAIQQTEKPLDLIPKFDRSKTLVQHLHQADPTIYKQSEEIALRYAEHLEELKIDDFSLVQASRSTTFMDLFTSFCIAIIGLPVFIYGAINNLLMVGVPALLVKVLKLDKGYDSNIKTVGGTIFWPLLYFIQMKIVATWTGSWWVALLYGLSIYPFGVAAWKYKEWVKLKLRIGRAKTGLAKNTHLLQLRQEALSVINKLLTIPLSETRLAKKE